MSDQVSHPYKTTGRIMHFPVVVLYVSYIFSHIIFTNLVTEKFTTVMYRDSLAF
jgi:thiosulfate reductase cytochrome b subunit